MKINLTTKLVTPKGEPVWDREPQALLTAALAVIRKAIAENWSLEIFKSSLDLVMEQHQQTELRDVLINALGVPPEDRKSLSGPDKRRRWRLANIISTADEADLSTADIELLKEAVDHAYPWPLIVGQVWDILDPTDEVKPKARPAETIPGR